MDQKNLTPDSALKAVVLEVLNESAVVLTEEGQFRSLRIKKGMTVGQSIYFFEDDVMEVSQRPVKHTLLSTIGKLASVSVAAAILLFSFVNVMGIMDSPVALITIDINPSLELAVTHKGIVKSLSGLNEDGERIKAQISFKGKTYVEVVQAILNEAKKEGYDLKTRETIVGIGALNEGSRAYAESIAKELNQLKAENHWLVYMTPELVKQEKGHHESIGKKLHEEKIQSHNIEEKDEPEDEVEIEHNSKTKIEDDSHENDLEDKSDTDDESDDDLEDEED